MLRMPREAAQRSGHRRGHGSGCGDGSAHRRIRRTRAVDQCAPPGSWSITRRQERNRDRAAPAPSAPHTLRSRPASCWSAGFVARGRSPSRYASAFPRARSGAGSLSRHHTVAHCGFHRPRHSGSPPGYDPAIPYHDHGSEFGGLAAACCQPGAHVGSAHRSRGRRATQFEDTRSAQSLSRSVLQGRHAQAVRDHRLLDRRWRVREWVWRGEPVGAMEKRPAAACGSGGSALSERL